MLRIRIFLLITLLFAPCLNAVADDAPPPEVVAALKSAGIPLSAVAIQVQPVQNGAAHLPRLAVNAARAMNPASTMKLVTSFAALELLGPTFTWKTQAFVTGTLNGDTLEGDLILKGGGDPKLTIENFWLLSFVSLGAVGFVLFLAGLLPFLAHLWRISPGWGRILLLCLVVVASSSSK